MQNVHPIFAPVIAALGGQAQALGDVGRAKNVIRTMKAALEQADEYLDRFADVKDGANGEVEANDAMVVQIEVRQAIAAAEAVLEEIGA